ncbi:transcriptional regulator MntR [Clostridium fermenticellae]|uniref:Manganese transport regulator n=1 Tax=Clostridium fermenticellae TaxID=2068654 RepID=A0A386H324_9CLOT|nr:transcriptional regulator MntR [Clostridium fermenticellae]AYD40112.1 transcriptional regulator MntR [Clostridium fermenticellae]
MTKNTFYTFNEYMKKEDNHLTASMEDYVEMIYRLSLKTGFTRIHELSNALNVQPPSATKMVQKLAELNLLQYKKYGILTLEEKGKLIGFELLKRHNMIEEFLKILDISETNILEETEKIEHTISKETMNCFNDFLEFIKINPEIADKFKDYRKNLKNQHIS